MGAARGEHEHVAGAGVDRRAVGYLEPALAAHDEVKGELVSCLGTQAPRRWQLEAAEHLAAKPKRSEHIREYIWHHTSWTIG